MILFIDCYDSFSYNLTHLIESACPSEISVVHHDKISAAQIADLLPSLDAIVIGPGPGDPHNASDRGVIADLWELVKKHPVPVFGVCFGYQSLVLAFGGIVHRMDPPRHGRVSQIRHNSQLFTGIDQDYEVVRYHSLCAEVNPDSSLVCSATALNDGIEMAAEHTSLPFFGVQFHPESVKSTFGKQLFANFWDIAHEYNTQNRKITPATIPRSLTVNYESLCQNPNQQASGDAIDLNINELELQLSWKDIAASLSPNFVFLKSAAFPGEWSIFGVLEPSKTVHIRSKNEFVYEGFLHDAPYVSKKGNIWEHTAQFMSPKMMPSQQAADLHQKFGLPFLGGIVGYVTYEGACLHTVNSGIPAESGMNSDVSFVYINKSLIMNESTGKIYAVGPQQWTHEIAHQLHAVGGHSKPEDQAFEYSFRSTEFPSYADKFDKCISKLLSGDSYELCLTTQADLEFKHDLSPFEVFVRLVEKNPAPYCSFMDFDDQLIASSPERFMAWDNAQCEFRPIKGTVKKGRGMTLEKATEILKTDKEQAENLMIVDLIRHDIGHLLHDVTTPQLMGVEEYHSVYQLVTSVLGHFSPESSITGIDVLSQSLPPGSMTGAPKQRSCQILNEIEDKPRGLYSGVQGYWGIDNRGDWSVIIRSLYKRRDDPAWHLGAGGGITILSTPKAEFEEMETKMDSVSDAFK